MSYLHKQLHHRDYRTYFLLDWTLYSDTSANEDNSFRSRIC
jgi:hypothetical protein